MRFEYYVVSCFGCTGLYLYVLPMAGGLTAKIDKAESAEWLYGKDKAHSSNIKEQICLAGPQMDNTDIY